MPINVGDGLSVADGVIEDVGVDDGNGVLDGTGVGVTEDVGIGLVGAAKVDGNAGRAVAPGVIPTLESTGEHDETRPSININK